MEEKGNVVKGEGDREYETEQGKRGTVNTPVRGRERRREREGEGGTDR